MSLIAIVDDSSTMRITIKRVIESICPRAEIKEISSGFDLLACYGKDKFDLIFLDYEMPNINGSQVLEAVKILNPDAKIVMCTSNATRETVVECISLGANDFLKKPVDLKEMSRILRKFEIIKY